MQKYMICLFDLILYIPVNIISVMSGQVFMGRTSTKQRIKCLAQGHAVPPGMQPLHLDSSNLPLSHRAPPTVHDDVTLTQQ